MAAKKHYVKKAGTKKPKPATKPTYDASNTVYVDPAKVRSPTGKPLTADDLRRGAVPLGIHHHQGSSPQAVDRALSEADVASNERRAQKAGKSRLNRDARLERLGGR